MSAKTKTPTAAKSAAKIGRPRGEKTYSVVRLEKGLALMARVVATARGETVADYLGARVGDAIRADYAKVVTAQKLE